MKNDPTGKSGEKSKTTEGGGKQPQVHTVKKGETLSGIAKQYGTTVEKLREANNLDPANDRNLAIGAKLNLQGAKAEKPKHVPGIASYPALERQQQVSQVSTQVNIHKPIPGFSGTTRTGIFEGKGPLYNLIGVEDPVMLRDGNGPFRSASLGAEVQVKALGGSYSISREVKEVGEGLMRPQETNVEIGVSAFDALTGGEVELNASLYMKFQLNGDFEKGKTETVYEANYSLFFINLTSGGELKIGTQISTTKTSKVGAKIDYQYKF